MSRAMLEIAENNCVMIEWVDVVKHNSAPVWITKAKPWRLRRTRVVGDKHAVRFRVHGHRIGVQLEVIWHAGGSRAITCNVKLWVDTVCGTFAGREVTLAHILHAITNDKRVDLLAGLYGAASAGDVQWCAARWDQLTKLLGQPLSTPAELMVKNKLVRCFSNFFINARDSFFTMTADGNIVRGLADEDTVWLINTAARLAYVKNDDAFALDDSTRAVCQGAYAAVLGDATMVNGDMRLYVRVRGDWCGVPSGFDKLQRRIMHVLIPAIRQRCTELELMGEHERTVQAWLNRIAKYT